MMNERLNQQIHIFLTGLLAFFIPAFPGILPLLIILIGVNWLLSTGNVVSGIRSIKQNYSFLVMVLLYLLYLGGMFYSDNLKFGREILETKFSFLLLPLIYSGYIKTTRENINKYLKFFVLGCLFYALFCFSHAAYAFFKPVYTDLYGVLYDLGANYFYYSYLSFLIHPSYTSMYAVTALIFILYLYKQGEIRFDFFWSTALFLLVIYILLLSSKAGWIGLALVTLFSMAWLISKKKIIPVLMIAPLIVALFLVLNVYYTPSFSQRIPKIETIENAISEKDAQNKEVTTSADGTGTRIFVWKASLEIFREHLFFGVGTGDSKDKMLEKYKERGMTTEYQFQLNSHNQFLNTAVALGVPGLLMLLLCFLIPFYYSIKEKKIILTGFILIVGINLLFESMLERQAGLVFYVFINTLLCSKLTNN